MATFVIVHGAWGGGWEWSPWPISCAGTGTAPSRRLLPGWASAPICPRVNPSAGEWAGKAGGDPVAAGAARARDAGWVYREISVGHDPQVSDAEGIARLLTGLTG